MKTVVSFYRFDFPLKDKIKVGGETLGHRRVGILRVQKGETFGFGEASPLPGLSSETFEDVARLQNFREIPSLNWALQSAQWNCQIRPERELPLCGLILQNEKDFLDQSIAFDNGGFRSVKLKVGKNLSNDFLKIQQILKQTKNIKLRLDFNFRASFKDLMNFAAMLKNQEGERFEYFEDAIKKDNLAEIADFREKTQFRLGYDEGLKVENLNVEGLRPSQARGGENTRRATWVLKPTQVGGDFMNEVKGQSVVVSSSFESNLGLFAAGQGAFEWQNEKVAHGLDTGKYFAENLFEIQQRNGNLLLPSDEAIRQKLTEMTRGMKPTHEVAW